MDPSEQGRESAHNVADHFREMSQTWKDRFILNNPRFCERYIKMEFHVLLQFRFRDSSEYVASLQRAIDDRGANHSSDQVRSGIAGRTTAEELRNERLPLTW